MMKSSTGWKKEMGKGEVVFVRVTEDSCLNKQTHAMSLAYPTKVFFLSQNPVAVSDSGAQAPCLLLTGSPRQEKKGTMEDSRWFGMKWRCSMVALWGKKNLDRENSKESKAEQSGKSTTLLRSVRKVGSQGKLPKLQRPTGEYRDSQLPRVETCAGTRAG